MAVIFDRVQARLQTRSAALVESIEGGMPRLMQAWFLVALLASALRVFASSLDGQPPTLASVFPYWLLTIAPLVSLGLALRLFAGAEWTVQPSHRLAVIGRWRPVSRGEAENHPLYGVSGIMVSLLVGILLNVPVRAAEYFAAMPALNGSAPAWLRPLHFVMTLDLVLLSSLYVIAFAAALRRVALFPRLLAAVWLIDILMQLAIAQVAVAGEALPPEVGFALSSLLQGNVQKVLISVAVWLPYLLLSKRVNVTFRQRVPL